MAHVWNKSTRRRRSTLAAGGAYEQKLYRKKSNDVRYFKVMDLADGKTAKYVKYETASEPVDELLKAVKTFKRNTMKSTGKTAFVNLEVLRARLDTQALESRLEAMERKIEALERKETFRELEEKEIDGFSPEQNVELSQLYGTKTKGPRTSGKKAVAASLLRLGKRRRVTP